MAAARVWGPDSHHTCRLAPTSSNGTFHSLWSLLRGRLPRDKMEPASCQRSYVTLLGPGSPQQGKDLRRTGGHEPRGGDRSQDVGIKS